MASDIRDDALASAARDADTQAQASGRDGEDAVIGHTVTNPVTSILKALGYLVSTLSVILLGAVAWKGASENPMLIICLVAGMATSIIGMALRWISHRIDQREKRKALPREHSA